MPRCPLLTATLSALLAGWTRSDGTNEFLSPGPTNLTVNIALIEHATR